MFFSESERQAIEDMACDEPAAVDWSVTHWSQRSLALAAVEQEIVADIHHTTIGDILREADLQPHRSRTWKTTIWDEEAVARTLRILWYYERIESLWRRGEVVLSPEGPQSERLLPDVARALDAEPQAKAFFEALATFYRNTYIKWIESAKRPATRTARINEMVSALKAGKKQK